MPRTVALNTYNNEHFNPGGNALKRLCWYGMNELIFRTGWFPVSGLKTFLLRLFGATIGKGVTIKPHVNIKYPWFLKIGDHVWIGENVWIDDLTHVEIGSHVCISQGAMLLTGNHNYKKSTFDLEVKGITLKEGVWIGAQAVVCPGVTCFSHSVLSVLSVATGDLDEYGIYQGNPAVRIRTRIIEE